MLNKNLKYILIGMGLYLTFETLNFIIQIIQHDILHKSKVKITHDKETITEITKNISTDLLTHINDFERGLNCMFFNSINNFSKIQIINSLKKCLLYPFHNDVDISHIHDIYNKYSSNNKSNETNNEQIIDWHENKLKIWYKPLFLVGMYEMLSMYSDYRMLSLGFTKYQMDDGLKIWYKNKFASNNGILFIHACAGGLVFQMNFLEKLDEKNALFIPEIPGISFGNRLFIPPSIASMSETLVNFIISKQINNLQFISHSFGSILISHIINHHYKSLCNNNINITNTILIEPIIFLPSLPYIYSLLNKDLPVIDVIHKMQYDFGRFITYITLLRDIYTQFYSQRSFFVSDILLGTTEYERKNTINIIYCSNDEISPTNECVHYLKSKKYNCNLKIFNNKSHGDFCLCSDMQEYVLSIIL